MVDYSFDEAQNFISSLLVHEIEGSSQIPTKSLTPSTPVAISAMDSKAEPDDVKNQPSPPLYARSALTPLGAPPEDIDITPDSSTSSEPRREQSRTTSV